MPKRATQASSVGLVAVGLCLVVGTVRLGEKNFGFDISELDGTRLWAWIGPFSAAFAAGSFISVGLTLLVLSGRDSRAVRAAEPPDQDALPAGAAPEILER
jgi:hypothetical protein